LNRPNHVGSVTLRVYVSKFGLPDRVEIRGQPEDPEFARDLQRALEQTSFLPGRQAGRDIASYVDYEFSGGVVEVRLAQRPGAS